MKSTKAESVNSNGMILRQWKEESVFLVLKEKSCVSVDLDIQPSVILSTKMQDCESIRLQRKGLGED